MGRIVDKREGLPLGELLLLLRSGYAVSCDRGDLTTMFTPSMKRHQIAMAYAVCRSGMFVVRETSQQTRPTGLKEGKTDDY